MLPYLLFDAGGTMVFPQADVICDVCAQHGCDMSVDHFIKGFYGAIHQLDEQLRMNANPSWVPKLTVVALEQAGLPAETASKVTVEAEEICGKRSFWRWSPDWVEPTLQRLQSAGYRMSVISNADGNVEDILTHLGLARYFERIFDSAIVGVEKPDRRIFDHALKELRLQAAECIYIGDVFSIDVVGANGAGMAAAHIDPYGRYVDWPGYHVTSIQDYAEQLIDARLALTNKLLVPFVERGIAASGA